MLKTLSQGLLNLLFPPNCSLCQSFIPQRLSTEFLCPQCRASIRLNFPRFCPKCSRHLPHTDTNYCNSCTQHNMHFDFAWCCCLYEESIRQLLHQFKYQDNLFLRHEFFRIMITFIETYHLDIHQFDQIIPIPLHPARERERKYNQSEILARMLSQHYQIPLGSSHLIRERNTQTQTQLNRKERWTNLKQAFRIKQHFSFKKQNILLIDDLLTTGATVSEASQILKQAGAQTVGILTLAVTPENHHV